jgi:nucleotide-binding universal stress UspA family protein
MTSFRKILVAIEFLPSAHRVLEAACGVADTGSALRLLHVVEWVPSVVEGALAGYGSPRGLREVHAESERQLRSYAQQCGGLSGVDVSTEVVEGQVAGTIADAADEWGADLVVVGASRRTGIGGFHSGGAVDRILRRSRCPVLVVPL